MTLVQREFVCWKRIYGLILRSHERCNQKKIHQLTSQLAEDRVLANRFLKTKALHTTDLSSLHMKGKVNMKPARALFHILRYVSMMDLYPLHHLLTGLVLKKAYKKIIKGHNLTFKSTDSPFFLL